MTSAKWAEQPDWVYNPCGKKYGRFPDRMSLSTYHEGTCGVCGEKKSVTEPRDFGYLNEWRTKSPT